MARMQDLLRHLNQRNGVYGVRVAIPPALQSEWGKTEEWKSLRTRDPNQALILGPPVRQAIFDRIASMRAAKETGAHPVVVIPLSPMRLTPQQVDAMIEDWQAGLIGAAYLDAYNGALPELDSGEKYVRSNLIYNLGQPQPWTRIADFNARHAEVLGVPHDHPAMRHSRVGFAEAWLEVEKQIDRFRRGDFTRWQPKEQAAQVEAVPPLVPPPTTSITLSALMERFVKAKKPSEESDLRNAWRRLIDFVGDVEAARVTQHQMEEWVLAVEKFPVTRKPEVVALDMRTILAQHSGENVLSPKSVWKWVGLADRVFVYAEAMKLIEVNPLTASKPKKPGQRATKYKRRSYTAGEIETLFTKPMFVGFSGIVDRGYREAPGSEVVKDAKYWLPIFALWHGCRLEEIGGAKLDEIKERDGVTYFDWLKRPLKLPPPLAFCRSIPS